MCVSEHLRARACVASYAWPASNIVWDCVLKLSMCISGRVEEGEGEGGSWTEALAGACVIGVGVSCSPQQNIDDDFKRQ